MDVKILFYTDYYHRNHIPITPNLTWSRTTHGCQPCFPFGLPCWKHPCLAKLVDSRGPRRRVCRILIGNCSGNVVAHTSKALRCCLYSSIPLTLHGSTLSFLDPRPDLHWSRRDEQGINISYDAKMEPSFFVSLRAKSIS